MATIYLYKGDVISKIKYKQFSNLLNVKNYLEKIEGYITLTGTVYGHYEGEKDRDTDFEIDFKWSVLKYPETEKERDDLGQAVIDTEMMTAENTGIATFLEKSTVKDVGIEKQEVTENRYAETDLKEIKKYGQKKRKG